jgi:hypothetical protein
VTPRQIVDLPAHHLSHRWALVPGLRSAHHKSWPENQNESGASIASARAALLESLPLADVADFATDPALPRDVWMSRSAPTPVIWSGMRRRTTS